MAEDRNPILRATSPMLIPAMKNLLDLKFGSTRTVDERERQASAARAGARVAVTSATQAEAMQARDLSQ
jgi:hypothetical protein